LQKKKKGEKKERKKERKNFFFPIVMLRKDENLLLISYKLPMAITYSTPFPSTESNACEFSPPTSLLEDAQD
jgi:hypothetical protein